MFNDFIIAAAPKIGVGQDLLAMAEQYAEEHPADFTPGKITAYSKSYKELPPLGRLALALFCLRPAKEQYDALGISDEVFVKTFSDIGIWCERLYKNTGKYGLEQFGWIAKHLSLKLFRLGRLQFEMIDFKFFPITKRKMRKEYAFLSGKKALSVHIAEGEPMGDDACSQSFAAAEEFFPKHFPDFDFKAYYCASWLLYPKNTEWMPKDGNIVKFMSRFINIGGIALPFQTFERLWQPLVGKGFYHQLYQLVAGKPKNLSELPENTSLQRAAKKYLQDGGRMGTGLGIILKGDAAQLRDK